jgi:ferric-dicitrate binding protein FerR (iron transport regulator)
MRAAWRHGRLVMGFVWLRKVISEINRYRRVP